MQDYITQSIQEGIRLKENILNNRQMLADIETVGNLIVQALRQGHKVLLCGQRTERTQPAEKPRPRRADRRQPMPSISLPNSSDVS